MRCVAVLIAAFTLSCVNTHGVMLYEDEIDKTCVRFGLMKLSKHRGFGFKVEGVGLDGTCKPKKIKAYRPIGKY